LLWEGILFWAVWRWRPSEIYSSQIRCKKDIYISIIYAFSWYWETVKFTDVQRRFLHPSSERTVQQSIDTGMLDCTGSDSTFLSCFLRNLFPLSVCPYISILSSRRPPAINPLTLNGCCIYHQTFHVLPTVYLCVLYGSQHPYTLHLLCDFVTETECVYCTVRTEFCI